jgi:serine protease
VDLNFSRGALAGLSAYASPVSACAVRVLCSVMLLGLPASAAGAERRSVPHRAPDDPALRVADATPGVAPGTPLEWWAAREGFPAAWAHTTGTGVRVGVIDTGVDVHHPDLRRQIVAAVRPPGDASPAPAGSDQDGHGTLVSSIACAGTGNGIGLAGAGDGCRLVVEKVDFSDVSIAEAIVDATKHGVKVLNLSFGATGRTDVPPRTRRALRYAFHRGVVLVAAASDDAQPGSPVVEQGDPANVLQPAGTGPHLREGIGLSVTAADFHDRAPVFAGSGSEISLAAYGTYDYGSLSDGLGRTGPPGLFGAFPSGPTTSDPPGGRCTCRSTFGGQSYGYLEGTSVAAPQVAGAAALVRALNPDLGPLAVVRLLKATARRGGGWTPALGWGILDAAAAVRRAATIDARAPVSRVTVVGSRRGSVTLRIVARDPHPPGVRASGVAAVELFVARAGGPPHLLIRTRRRLLHVPLRPQDAHAFFTRAVDRAGNREARPRP